MRSQSIEETARSRHMRQNMTEEEVMMWTALKAYRAHGYAFRRQAPIGPYFPDFLCRKAKLIVEVDGRHHDLPAQIEHDTRRDAWLSVEGYTVIRISAHDVRTNLHDITDALDAQLGITS